MDFVFSSDYSFTDGNEGSRRGPLKKRAVQQDVISIASSDDSTDDSEIATLGGSPNTNNDNSQISQLTSNTQTQEPASSTRSKRKRIMVNTPGDNSLANYHHNSSPSAASSHGIGLTLSRARSPNKKEQKKTETKGNVHDVHNANHEDELSFSDMAAKETVAVAQSRPAKVSLDPEQQDAKKKRKTTPPRKAKTAVAESKQAEGKQNKRVTAAVSTTVSSSAIKQRKLDSSSLSTVAAVTTGKDLKSLTPTAVAKKLCKLASDSGVLSTDNSATAPKNPKSAKKAIATTEDSSKRSQSTNKTDSKTPVPPQSEERVDTAAPQKSTSSTASTKAVVTSNRKESKPTASTEKSNKSRKKQKSAPAKEKESTHQKAKRKVSASRSKDPKKHKNDSTIDLSLQANETGNSTQQKKAKSKKANEIESKKSADADSKLSSAERTAAESSIKEKTAAPRNEDATTQKKVAPPNATVASKPPPAAAKKKKKKLTFQDQVLNHMLFSFKPFTIRTLADELKTTDTQLNFVLLSLLDKGLVFKKEFTSGKAGGRVKVLYWGNHEGKAKEVNLKEQATVQEREVAKIEMMELRAKETSLKNALAQVLQQPSNDDLSVKLAQEEVSLQQDKRLVEEAKTRIDKAQSTSPKVASNCYGRGLPPKSEALLARERCPHRIRIRTNAMRAEWKKRKEKCMDFVDQLADGMEKKPKEVVKLLDIETDEMCNAVMPPKHSIE